MKQLLFALLLVSCVAAPARGAGLHLTIQDGKVTLDAQDVTIRQILTEWARVGKTRIVNVERVSGGPVTLKFDALPEKQALDIILRAVPGYVAAPRETLVANASLYEAILVMPTTTAVAAVRPPQPGVPGGLAGPGPAFSAFGNVTQLRQPPMPTTPPAAQEPPDPADDPALAAAAAAGLLPAPAPPPGTAIAAPAAPLTLPGQVPATTPAPTNPWNAPVGTAQPSLAPPPAAVTPPAVRPRPQAPDR